MFLFRDGSQMQNERSQIFYAARQEHLKNVLPLVQNDNYSEPKLVCRQLFSNVYEDIKSVYTFFQFLSQQNSK